MNTPSPLVPEGTTPQRGKSSLFFKVMMIVAIHVVVIGGMLMQGCKDSKDNQKSENTQSQPTVDNTSNTPPVNPPLPPLPEQQPLAGASSNTAVTPVTTLPPVPDPAYGSTSAKGSTPAPAGETREYVVAAHDTMGGIAKKMGVSLKALKEANPGVTPTKLQIGHKLVVPSSSTVASATPSAAGAVAGAEAGDSATYTVKSGDMLLKIAKSHGTSVKAIMALNDLKTTGIRVGQKLKLPAGKTAAEPAATPATSASAASAPSASASPVSSPAPATASAAPVPTN